MTHSRKHITREQAAEDIDEFEFLLSFRMPIERACDRIGLHPQAIKRRYRVLGRPVPGGLETLIGTFRSGSAV